VARIVDEIKIYADVGLVRIFYDIRVLLSAFALTVSRPFVFGIFLLTYRRSVNYCDLLFVTAVIKIIMFTDITFSCFSFKSETF
jgi:hypothetical protein